MKPMKLYPDSQLKSTSGYDKKIPVAGNMHRFAHIHKQLRRNYDLNEISYDTSNLLPPEFNQWIDK